MRYDKIEISDFSKNEFRKCRIQLKNVIFFICSEFKNSKFRLKYFLIKFKNFKFTFTEIEYFDFIKSHININLSKFSYSSTLPKCHIKKKKNTNQLPQPFIMQHLKFNSNI